MELDPASLTVDKDVFGRELPVNPLFVVDKENNVHTGRLLLVKDKEGNPYVYLPEWTVKRQVKKEVRVKTAR